MIRKKLIAASCILFTSLNLTACTNITGSVSALKATCPNLKTVIVNLTQCVQ